MNYKAIIFDVSDTLVEYSPNYATIFGDRLSNLKYEISKEKAYEISRAVNWAIGEQNRKEQYGEAILSVREQTTLMDKAALNCIKDQVSDLNSDIAELSKHPLPVQQMSIIEDVVEVLTILKRNYLLGIVSNHYSWLMNYLQDSGLASYFKTIIISEIVNVSKPNPKIMQIALDNLKLSPKECLYVGDQPIDVLCSKQAGLDCAWINKDNIDLPRSISYQEDYRIGRIKDLLELL